MRVRPVASASDELTVRQIFRATIALGRPLDDEVAALDRYESLCLDWYLAPGRGAAIVEAADGVALGYALVCTDQPAWSAWATRRAVRMAPAIALRSALGGAPSRRFWATRLADGLRLRRASAAPPMPAHAHLNLLPAARASRAGRLLVEQHVDVVVGDAGHPGWYGEVNALAGRRAAALERLGGEIVRREANRTLTDLCGQPIERLTVVRTLARLASTGS